MPTRTYHNLPEEKRLKVEEAAIAEFAANPLQSASVNAIVSEAGIAKGSFYQYFENIDDLHGHILSLIYKKKLEVINSLPLDSANLDTFRYLRRVLQAAVEFQIRYPDLASIDRFQRLNFNHLSSIDPETGERVSGDGRFHALLTQGILHDDIATWVDVDMAAFMLEIIAGGIAPYLVERIGEKASAIASGKLSTVYDRTTQDLFDNLMDILEGGLARDPQIRKDFYSK
jgi:AcrR family transcriptional regulator